MDWNRITLAISPLCLCPWCGLAVWPEGSFVISINYLVNWQCFGAVLDNSASDGAFICGCVLNRDGSGLVMSLFCRNHAI